MKVFIEPGAVVCAAATRVDLLWQSLVDGTVPKEPLPCPAYDTWPWPEVYATPEPGALELGVDRKVLRTMEKQAKLALYGACLSADARASLQDKHISPARRGLYLAIPTVDESVPPWTLLETLHEESAQPAQPAELNSTEFLLREIPAFFGLSTLNSNTCAHISARFGLMGAMGAYSPFADAAFQALIDAVESIRNGENHLALVGAVSPKINPQLLVQYNYWGWDQKATRIPAEASAFAVVGAQPRATSVSGFARGFIADPAQAISQRAALLQQALGNAGLTVSDLDWFIAGEDDLVESAALVLAGACASLPFLFSEAFLGYAGAANPLLNLNLALAGVQQQMLLEGDSRQPLQCYSRSLRHVALSAAGPEGQYIVVIISREEAL
ncbi:beta-ketoacyl synthase N-terminal-like domain-containing protein [Cellvibrio mixtus]|uniref:beta-ketoacyl synthase N-terminal-like domain-containing protein n=1 Tax=Cellvibrio mixtus TaxID=39650 RepID=UPI0005880188|nr:beta-ketoacyl synthase N-terminal-like domain-containing protein [Cellvibrio mixtus]